jgi:hypothetical protein
MTTELVGRFRCEACDIEFDSIEAFIKHNLEQSIPFEAEVRNPS